MELLHNSTYEHQLTDNSKILIEELHKFNTKYLKMTPDISKTKYDFFKKMYNDIINAKKDFKKQRSKQFTRHEITSVNQIPKPESFHPHFFPDEIIKTIDANSTHYLSYDYKIGNRTVSIFLVFLDDNAVEMDYYEHYTELIYVVTHILNNYSSIECGKNLQLYIYLTDFKKTVPNSSLDEFDTKHVNTAYSDVCALNSQIVIYRSEEWVKVLIHELFHNYGLDFAKVNYDELKRKMKELFPIKSDFEMAESYAEFFGEIINIAITTFYLDEEISLDMYLKNAQYLLFYEQLFSLIQSVKIMYKIGLSYENLFLQDEASISLRNNIYYQENTNVFCYYVVKNILLFNCDDFITFCTDRNLQLLDFRKTDTNLNYFYDFIQKRYKNKSMINIIHKIEKKLKDISNPFLKNTARISGIELK